MKFTICPECREVIGDDELRGSSKICRACARRTDRSDLVEIDTEKTEESLPQSEPNQTGDASFNANGEPFDPNGAQFNPEGTPYDPNGFAGQAFSTLLNNPEFASKLDQVPSFMRGMVDNALAGVKNQVTPIPVIHSLDELYIISDAQWENEADIRDMGYLRTLVVKQPGAIGQIIMGLLFAGLGTFIFSLILEDGILGALLFLLVFGGCGVWMLYCGIMSHAKVWIRIFRDRLEIRRGFRKNGKYRVYTRSHLCTSVSIDTNGKPNQPDYYITIQNRDEYHGNNKYTLASGLPPVGFATEFTRMLDTILKAEL